MKSTTLEKFKFLSEKLEEIYMKEDILSTFDLLIGDFEEGYTLTIIFNDKYLILNDVKSSKEMKELLKKYGIENYSWYDIDEREKRKIVHKSLNAMSKEEKEEKMKVDEENKKKEEEKIILQNNLKNSLKNQEKFIKIKFKKTKKNTKIFKNIFFSLKNKILSNKSINDIK